jgi:hypothetical protein
MNSEVQKRLDDALKLLDGMIRDLNEPAINERMKKPNAT